MTKIYQQFISNVQYACNRAGPWIHENGNQAFQTVQEPLNWLYGKTVTYDSTITKLTGALGIFFLAKTVFGLCSKGDRNIIRRDFFLGTSLTLYYTARVTNAIPYAMSFFPSSKPDQKLETKPKVEVKQPAEKPERNVEIPLAPKPPVTTTTEEMTLEPSTNVTVVPTLTPETISRVVEQTLQSQNITQTNQTVILPQPILNQTSVSGKNITLPAKVKVISQPDSGTSNLGTWTGLAFVATFFTAAILLKRMGN